MLELNESQLQEFAKIAGIEDVSKITKSESGEDLNPEGIYQNLSGAIKSRLESFAKRVEETKEQRFKQGWKESRQAIEERIKKFGIEDFNDAEDALEKLQSQFEQLKTGQAGKGKLGELTKEDLEQLPLFKELLGTSIQAKTQKLRQEIEAERQEKAKLLQEFERKEKFDILRTHLSRIIKEKNGNMAKAGFDKSVDLFVADAGGIDNFDIIKNGADVSLKPMKIENGERVPVKDEYYNEVSFEDFTVKRWDSIFGFNAAPDGGGANPKNGGGGGNSKYRIESMAQLKEMIAKNPAKRAEYMKAFAERNT